MTILPPPDLHVDLYCFDVDGTLVKTKSGETFRKTADDWEWLPGRLDTLRLLIAHGKWVALVTNQGGVAFGYMDVDDISAELERMLVDIYGLPGELDVKLGQENFASVFAFGGRPGHYEHLRVCFSHPTATREQFRVPQAEDYFRKPAPGMLIAAMLDHHAYPRHTLMVGDREEDALAASNAGCKFMWADHFFSEHDEDSVSVVEISTTETMETTAVGDPLSLVDQVYAFVKEHGRASTANIMAEFNLGGHDASIVGLQVQRRLQNECENDDRDARDAWAAEQQQQQDTTSAWGPISEEQKRYADYYLAVALREMKESAQSLQSAIDAMPATSPITLPIPQVDDKEE